MGLEEFLTRARDELGYHPDGEDAGSTCLHKTGNFLWVSQEGDRVGMTRYGQNDEREVVEHFDMVSEHDDEYWEILED